MEGIVKTFDIGDGRMISIETGKLAKQADGACVVKMGNTMLLATVVAAKKPKKMWISCHFRLNTVKNMLLRDVFPVVSSNVKPALRITKY